jgi:hypothetical protein
MGSNKTLIEEEKTWCIADPVLRKEKAMREFIRYPLLIRQMGLAYLDTSEMVVWDIGAGPLGGVSSLLNCKSRVCVDPLTDGYRKYFACNNYDSRRAEDLKEDLSIPDLVIVTNALDHFDNPPEFLHDLSNYLHCGAYFAHLHAIDNAFAHPHPAHAHNLNPQYLDSFMGEFEKVWSLDFVHDGLVYGWKKEPAFCGLYRKVTGYV